MACNKLYNSMFTPWTSCDTAHTNVLLFNFFINVLCWKRALDYCFS